MADNLDTNTRDRLVALTRGAANSVPFVGGLLGELVTDVIPGQRQERIVAYLRRLNERIEQMEPAAAKAALENPEKVDLVERGGYQAIRATSAERINQIAEAVAKGLKSDEAAVIRRKRLLGLLAELDDDEIAMLAAYENSLLGGDRSAWEKLNIPEPPHMGSSKDEFDKNRLYELGRERLLRLNLLRRRFRVKKKGELPEFDPGSGGFKGTVEISSLGRMLLREIGIEEPPLS